MTNIIIQKLERLSEKIASEKDMDAFFFDFKRYTDYITETPLLAKLVSNKTKTQLSEEYCRLKSLADGYDKRFEPKVTPLRPDYSKNRFLPRGFTGIEMPLPTDFSDYDIATWDFMGFPMRRKEVLNFNDTLIKELAKELARIGVAEKKPASIEFVSPSSAAPKQKTLKSIILIGDSAEPKKVIYMVLDERYGKPIRFDVWNQHGEETAIKKLYGIAYLFNVDGKKSYRYDRRLAGSINNDLFKKEDVADYVKSNGFKKPTLVAKSGDMLVLKSGLVKIMRPAGVPVQYRRLYESKDQ